MSRFDDSINITGLYAVMGPNGQRLQLTGSIQQARTFLDHLMNQYPDEDFGLFEMKGGWKRGGLPRATILKALEQCNDAMA